MRRRVKTFFDAHSLENLEKRINQFLTCVEGELIDIKFDAMLNEDAWGPSALVIFIPKEYLKTKEEVRNGQKEMVEVS